MFLARKGEARAFRPRARRASRLTNVILRYRAQKRGEGPVKVQIDPRCCQGHGRCYDLAPSLFGDDEEGYGTVLDDGTVPPGREHDARLAVLNCPERAIELIEGL